MLKTSALIVFAAVLLFSGFAAAAEKKETREEGQFDIYMLGKEIGREKFTIQLSPDMVESRSQMSFRDPGNQKREVKLQTDLKMDGQFVPLSYRMQSDVGGQKGVVSGTFSNGKVTYEYQAGGPPSKTVLLVGDQYTVLDTNIFHHYIFIAKRFDLDVRRNAQSLEIAIPQELRNGVLKVSYVGLEKTSVRGRERELHHLRANSGTVLIELWIDDSRMLYKIALPAKGVEAVRG